MPSSDLPRPNPKDYEFQLVQKELKMGEAVVAVRLVDKRSGKPVPDAVIFAKRIDMAPDGCRRWTRPSSRSHPPSPASIGSRPGLTMAGGWQLSLGAKVQGEEGTVENKLVLKASK